MFFFGYLVLICVNAMKLLKIWVFSVNTNKLLKWTITKIRSDRKCNDPIRSIPTNGHPLSHRFWYHTFWIFNDLMKLYNSSLFNFLLNLCIKIKPTIRHLVNINPHKHTRTFITSIAFETFVTAAIVGRKLVWIFSSYAFGPILWRRQVAADWSYYKKFRLD